MVRKRKTNGFSSRSANRLAGDLEGLAREGYVAMPVREVFGGRMEHAGKAWHDVYNAYLGAGEDGRTANAGDTSPVGVEIPVNDAGSKGLGYISWGSNNKLPNNIAMLVSLLPYTAVGVKFNTDVISGLGPKPKFRYYRYVNGVIRQDSMDYMAAGTFLEGQLFEKRKKLLDLLSIELGRVRQAEPLMKDIIGQLEVEIRDAEESLETWKRTKSELEEFLKVNNLDLVFTEMANDMSHLGICFPELQLDRQGDRPDDVNWNPKVIGINYRSACTCRLERMDVKNEINYVYVSNQWLDNELGGRGTGYGIAAIPALNPHRPLQSLQDKVRNVRVRAYNLRKDGNGQRSERPTHFILPCYYPSLGRPYYPEPAWFSIFKGDVYRYCSTIIENRAIAKDNSNSAGKIIYIHTEYLAKLYMQANVNKLEDKEKLRDRMWDEINEFLKNRENNGQTILSFTFIGSDGKEHDAWRIVDVPISSKQEADANKTELEELSNIIFLALGIHSVLIGNSIGGSNTGGTQQRELYELKKLFSVPTQRLLLAPFYVARDLNGWDGHLEWEIGQMTLTTLDRNKNGIEETKV